MAYTSPRGSPNPETGTSGWNDFDVLTLVILRYVNVVYVGRYASSSKHIKYMQLHCEKFPKSQQCSPVSYTVKTVATEIHPPESTEIKSIYVAFQTGAHKRAFSVATATENFSSVQSFSD